MVNFTQPDLTVAVAQARAHLGVVQPHLTTVVHFEDLAVARVQAAWVPVASAGPGPPGIHLLRRGRTSAFRHCGTCEK